MFKKFILLLAVLMPLTAAQANEISPETAVAKARQLLEEQVDGFSAQLKSVRAFSYEGQKAYYVVQFTPGGWAMISADDMSSPFIGYSPDGVFQTENQPENFRGMMEVYAQQVVRNARLFSEPHKGWQQASRPNKAPRKASGSDKVEPLIKVNWNQSGKFNKYCPEDANGRALVGCVAVGMAQAMSVAKWPKRPVGEFSYTSENYGSMYINYDKEPAYNWNNILSGANDRDDVARLLWHCGVAVKMDYGTDGSGTQTSYIPAALQRNFSYPNSVKFYSRKDFSNSDWNDLILNELKAGRAVAYSGYDPKKSYGHCFNLDGYNGQWYHVNWGWGGSNNDYFSLDALRDKTMDMDYTEGQGVVVGIRAPSEKPSNIVLSHNIVLAGKPKGTKVGDITVESEAENPTYSFKVQGEWAPLWGDYLPAPFEVKNGELVTTEDNLEVGDYTVTITATNTKNKASVSRDFTIHVSNVDAISSAQAPATTASEQYFSPSGAQLSTPQPGLNIIRQRMSDGSTRTTKVILK